MLTAVAWHMVRICTLNHKRELLCAKVSDSQWSKSVMISNLNKLIWSMSLPSMHCQVIYLAKIKTGSFRYSNVCVCASHVASAWPVIKKLFTSVFLWSSVKSQHHSKTEKRNAMRNDNWLWINSKYALNKTKQSVKTWGGRSQILLLTASSNLSRLMQLLISLGTDFILL